MIWRSIHPACRPLWCRVRRINRTMVGLSVTGLQVNRYERLVRRRTTGRKGPGALRAAEVARGPGRAPARRHRHQSLQRRLVLQHRTDPRRDGAASTKRSKPTSKPSTSTPTTSQALNHLGIDLHPRRPLQDAIKTFERIEQLDATFEPSYCNRIITYSELGDHEKAEEMFYLARLYKEQCPRLLLQHRAAACRRAACTTRRSTAGRRRSTWTTATPMSTSASPRPTGAKASWNGPAALPDRAAPGPRQHRYAARPGRPAAGDGPTSTRPAKNSAGRSSLRPKHPPATTATADG